MACSQTPSRRIVLRIASGICAHISSSEKSTAGAISTSPAGASAVPMQLARGEQRDPAAHRRADQDRPLVAAGGDHGERVLEPVRHRPAPEIVARFAMAGIVEAQEGAPGRARPAPPAPRPWSRACRRRSRRARPPARRCPSWARKRDLSPVLAVADLQPLRGRSLHLKSPVTNPPCRANIGCGAARTWPYCAAGTERCFLKR